MPVARVTTKVIEGVLQQSTCVCLCVWVSWWRYNASSLIPGKAGVAEGVLAVALLEDVAVLCGHEREKIQGGVLQHGYILLALLPEATFEVAKDNDERLGTVLCHVLIVLGGHHTHGGDCLQH